MKTYGFGEFEAKLNGFAEEFNKKIDEKLIDIATEAVAETQLLTPVDTGNLRRSITHGDPQTAGDVHSIEVGTVAKYAEAVEEGHKTKNGGFVKGQHMFGNAFTKVNKNSDKNLEKWFAEMTEEFKL